MGTRADFYVGDGPDAEWLGSIAFDGDPEGEPSVVLDADSEPVYRERVAQLLSSLDDATLPAMGWPWPWNDSSSTDYAYTWLHGGVHVSQFGAGWRRPGRAPSIPRLPSFPNMSARRTMPPMTSSRSGLIVIVVPDELP